MFSSSTFFFGIPGSFHNMCVVSIVKIFGIYSV
ncbi:uncharacterized protein METZ01_LOCUS370271 [marine metagenome]|uniref:Uncharacterized protein n=1 Tax=marine metagenome TaxID=408172 RepID=A0A382T7G0_9ZZZZ